jgi:hypothetical protein
MLTKQYQKKKIVETYKVRIFSRKMEIKNFPILYLWKIVIVWTDFSALAIF